jgi:acyl dehydratase
MTIAVAHQTLALRGVADIRALQGQPPRESPWIAVDQAMVDRFAEVTRDHQWIHVDAARARNESPTGGTIAHGFLTLSLLSHLLGQVFTYPGRRSSLNYGFDRVRFTAAVPVGSRIRAAVALGEASVLGESEVRVAWDVKIEVEGQARPALVARWLVQMNY